MSTHKYLLACLLFFSKSRETEEPVVQIEKNVTTEKQSGEEDAVDANKDSPVTEPEEKEPEDKVGCLLLNLVVGLFLHIYIFRIWFQKLETCNHSIF